MFTHLTLEWFKQVSRLCFTYVTTYTTIFVTTYVCVICSLHFTMFGGAFVPILNCVPSASASVASKHLSAMPTSQSYPASNLEHPPEGLKLLTSVDKYLLHPVHTFLYASIRFVILFTCFCSRGSASQTTSDSLCISLRPLLMDSPTLPSLQLSRE